MILFTRAVAQNFQHGALVDRVSQGSIRRIHRI